MRKVLLTWTVTTQYSNQGGNACDIFHCPNLQRDAGTRKSEQRVHPDFRHRTVDHGREHQPLAVRAGLIMLANKCWSELFS